MSKLSELTDADLPLSKEDAMYVIQSLCSKQVTLDEIKTFTSRDIEQIFKEVLLEMKKLNVYLAIMSDMEVKEV